MKKLICMLFGHSSMKMVELETKKVLSHGEFKTDYRTYKYKVVCGCCGTTISLTNNKVVL